MHLLTLVQGTLDTIEITARPAQHESRLRLAVILCACLSMTCLYLAVLSTRGLERRAIITATAGLSFGFMACVLAALVVLNA